MPIVIVPPPYQGPTRGISKVEVPATTIRGAVEAMDLQYPGFAPLLFTSEGDLHRFVKIFCNGEPVEGDSLDASVAADDEIEVVAAIAGG